MKNGEFAPFALYSAGLFLQDAGGSVSLTMGGFGKDSFDFFREFGVGFE
ncbi:hypothetical protein [Gimesia chilikensis]|nr:hypothetical protein [Gimesia chilikensis]